MAATSGANHSAIVTHHHRTVTSASRRRHQAMTSTAIASTDTVASRGEPPLADHVATPGHSTPTFSRGSAPDPHEAAARSTPPRHPAQRAREALDEPGDPDARARRSTMRDRLVTPGEQAPPGLGVTLHRDDVGVVEAAPVEELCVQPQGGGAPDPHRGTVAHRDRGLVPVGGDARDRLVVALHEGGAAVAAG